MTSKSEPTAETAEHPGNLLVLALLAPVAGAIAGLLGSIFRLALVRGDHLRDALIFWAHGRKTPGFFIVTLSCAAATALAAWLVRRYSPLASGSGIPLVEAALEGKQQQAPFPLIPVKFFGGLFAMARGWRAAALVPACRWARAAPTPSKICKRNLPDPESDGRRRWSRPRDRFQRANGRSNFCARELVRRFEPRVAIVALGASSAAVTVAHLFFVLSAGLGCRGFVFYGNNETGPLFFVLGAVATCGIVSMARFWGQWPRRPSRPMARELRAAYIGAAVGMLAWFAG